MIFRDAMGLFGRETPGEQARVEAWGQWARERNPYALASAALGIFSAIELGVIPFFSIGGLVLGIVALRQLSERDPTPPKGHRLAWLGIVLSSIAIVIGASLYVHRFMSP